MTALEQIKQTIIEAKFLFQSEPFEDVATYRGDVIVGLKFIPLDSGSSAASHGIISRKLSLRSSFLHSNPNNPNLQSTKGSLHVMVKEAKHLSPVKASGHVDSFCKRYKILITSFNEYKINKYFFQLSSTRQNTLNEAKNCCCKTI